MRGVLRLAGLGLRRGQRRALALMLVVIALAATALIAGATVAGGAEGRIDGAFDRARGPDLVVYASADDAAAVAVALAGDNEIDDVAPVVAARPADMRVGEGDATVPHRMLTTRDGQPGDEARRVGDPVVRSGRMPLAADEVALDAAVALRFGIDIGDRVAYDDTQGAPVDYRVVGTAFDFADCFYPTCDPGRSWVTAAGQGRLGPPTTAVIFVALDDPAHASLVEQRLAGAAGDDRFSADSWLDTRGDLLAETDFFAAFLSAFGLFALVTSSIVIAAGVTARTIANRRRTGICKTVGATPRQLVIAQLVEHAAVAAVASVLGWFAAALFTPRLRVGALRVLGSDGPTFHLTALAVTTAAVVVIVAVVTVVPAWRASREPAVDAIRDAPRSRRRSRSGDAVVALGAPVAVELGVRTFTARPFRSATAVAASVVAVAVAIIALSINHSMDHLLANPTLSGDPWDVAFTPADGASSDDVARQLDGLPQVARWFTMVEDTVGWNGGRVHVRVLGGDPAAATYAIGEGRRAISANEAIVGYGLVEEDGVGIGDVLSLEIDGRTAAVTVVGWYRETEDSGRIIQLRDDTRASTFAGRGSTYFVAAAPETTPSALAGTLHAFGGDVELNRIDSSALAPFRAAMAAMTALIAAVAVAHLLATALATAREHTRSTAILRAAGVSIHQVASAAVAMGVATAIGATTIGVPLGLWLQGVLGNEITSSIGVGPGVSQGPPAAITVAMIAALMLIAIGVVTAVEVRTSRRAVARMLAAD